MMACAGPGVEPPPRPSRSALFPIVAAIQGTNTLSVFRIDEKTGTLTAVGPLAEVGTPVCVLFVP